MPDLATIDSFLDAVEVVSGDPPLSDAKLDALSDPSRVVVIEEDGVVVAVGVVASHRQSDGSTHWSMETVVAPAMQFSAFESMVVAQTRALIPAGAKHSVWSSRSTLDEGLNQLGYACKRRLLRMDVDLPVDDPDPTFATESFKDGQEQRLIAVNTAAFAEHREAGSLDPAELRDLMHHDWWDPAGVLFHTVDGSEAAFCWTKVHEDGRGEIYRIGVDSAFRGQGIGRNILLAGLAYLHNVRGSAVGFLWVDDANTAAVGLYESIGMTTHRSNSEWEPVR